MSDRDDISDLLIRYATGIDTRDWALFRSCFTPDCVCDYGAVGVWQGVDQITRFMQKSHDGPSMHRLSNLAINVSGDRATARTYVDAIVSGPRGLGAINNIGHYDDEFIRTRNGWRIARRSYTSMRVRLPGPLSTLPNALSSRLAALGARMIGRSS